MRPIDRVELEALELISRLIRSGFQTGFPARITAELHAHPVHAGTALRDLVQGRGRRQHRSDGKEEEETYMF